MRLELLTPCADVLPARCLCVPAVVVGAQGLKAAASQGAQVTRGEPWAQDLHRAATAICQSSIHNNSTACVGITGDAGQAVLRSSHSPQTSCNV